MIANNGAIGALMDDIPEHMEAALGPISRGWSDPSSRIGVQVVSFENTPDIGVTTLATLGLSKYVLEQSSGKHVRQELLTSVEAGTASDTLAKVLLAIAEHQIEQGTSLARGELVTPRYESGGAPLISTFYCTNPSPLDSRLTDTERFVPPLIFVYLIAVLENEASLVREHGWRWFEEQLEGQDPNIWNLARTEGVVEQ